MMATNPRTYRRREHPDDRTRRLAQEADQRGILIDLQGTMAIAIEPSRPIKRYPVTRVSCTCYCFMHSGECAHHAKLLAVLGELPGERPHLEVVQALLPSGSVSS